MYRPNLNSGLFYTIKYLSGIKYGKSGNLFFTESEEAVTGPPFNPIGARLLEYLRLDCIYFINEDCHTRTLSMLQVLSDVIYLCLRSHKINAHISLSLI